LLHPSLPINPFSAKSTTTTTTHAHVQTLWTYTKTQKGDGPKQINANG
jgi:hypothetical protein